MMIDKIDEKSVIVDAYHDLMKSAEEYGRLSPNIPKCFMEVSQHIHGRFDDAAYNIYRAGNSFDKNEKLECLHKAKDDIFFQYSSLDYLVRLKAITVGSANNVIVSLKTAYDGVSKWLSSTTKTC